MFVKLLKYDLKSMLKTIVPLWIGAFLLSLSCSFINVFSPDSDGGQMMVFVFGLTLFCFYLALIVVNFILVIQRFWNGLLKDEGYLMFTIPTTPRMLIISKVVSSTIISVGTAVLAYVSAFVVMNIYTYVVDNSYLIDFINTIIHMTFSSVFEIVSSLLTLLVSAVQKIYLFYLAMAIGHLSHKNRFLCSFGAFVVINIITGIIGGAYYQILDHVLKIDSMNETLWATNLLCIVLIIVAHIGTEYILTEKLNLE